MTKYEIVKTTDEHMMELSYTMREADANEAWASLHLDPYEALSISRVVSRDTYTGLANGEIICIFGVRKLTVVGGTGIPWMFTSNAVEKHTKPFLLANRGYVENLMEEFQVLTNYVDARNVVAIRWLDWLGFKFYPAVPYGPDGLPFFKFEMRGN